MAPRTFDPNQLTPEQALQRLIDGNRRFREGDHGGRGRPWSSDLATRAQQPFAIVVGCSDSRTPVEILFDEGFGDLFVVRVAGNIGAPSVVGSVEFAASQFGTRLVVVMGHTRCGAIGATLSALQTGLGPESQNIRFITDRIAPHLEGLVRLAGPEPEDRERLFREAVRANVRAAADHLRHGSRLLEDLVLAGRIAVVGAVYELETGEVHFLNSLPSGPPLVQPPTPRDA